MREKLKTLPLVQLREMAKAQGLKGISTLKKAEIIDRLCELEKPVEEGQKEETPQASVSEHPAGSAEPAERTEMHVQPRRTDAGQNTSAQTYSQPRRSANGERAAGGQNSSYERRSEGGYRRNEYGSYTRRENNNTRYQDNRRREYTQREGYQRNSYVPRNNYNEAMSARTEYSQPEHTAPAPQMAEAASEYSQPERTAPVQQMESTRTEVENARMEDLKNEFQADSFYWGMKSIITIHNLKFQGVWDVKTMKGLTGFSADLFAPDKLEFHKDANMLKGGLVYADYITTVSDSYAQEIQTDYYGEGLDGLLAARHFDMQGIVNGIDYKTYDPETDPKIYTNYNASNFRKKKVNNKLKLQEELDLTVDKKKFMIGLISRLTDQKGLDLINYVIDRLVDDFTQIVVIGTGDPQYENMFRHYAWKYGDRVSANICYSDDLAHKLYAAADAFLMPSRFEPCGLTQLISFRYGTVPIVRETGGLKDTVRPYNEYENTGDGFSFANYNGEEMLGVVNYAKHIYFDKKKQWNQIVERGMANDYSWKSSKGKYEGLYNYLIGYTV